MARRVWLVARHAAREMLGARLWYVVAAFAIILFVVSRLAGPLSAGEEVKVVKDLGLAGIELSGALFAILIGANLIERESDRRTLQTLLAKPLARWEFLAGQFIGLTTVLALHVLSAGAALFLVLLSMPGPTETVPAADPRMAVALLLIAAELALLGAVAVFFSVFSSNVVLAALFSLGVFVAGQLSADLRAFQSAADTAPWIATVVSTVGWLLPSFSSFDVKAEVVHGVDVPPPFVAVTCAYAALYATALIAGAAALFSRREFP